MLMNYKKLNAYTGWLVFLIATIVYFLTIEDTASLWDCGEYITAAYKLEVGHPPGAPLFMLLGRLFSFFAAPENVAMWINRMSALSSSGTILFMFWSITMLAKKIAFQGGRNLSNGDTIAIIGSGFIGAIAYTFTDSFWFSAVEGEVYAMSSLFTAIIFWAILKWDEEMNSIKHGEIDGSHSPMRWMILIMFLFGLAIGVHLLGLLVIPTIGYVIYFNQWEKFKWKSFFITGILSILILGFIQEGIIPGTISWASKFEIAFVNSLGLPFYMGSSLFFILLIVGLVYLVRWSRKKNKPIYNAIGLGLIFFLIGYGTFAVIVIRSNANTPLDENDPENLVTLHAYLKREQYGSWPILYGPYWNSEMDDQRNFKDRSRFYARRFVVTKGEKDLKAYRSEEAAREYIKDLGRGYDVVEKYFVTNEEFRKNQEPVYLQNTIFPRMFWTQDAPKINGYKQWSGYDQNGDDLGAEKGNDGKRLPTFGENLTYFARYQVNWMYWRYFMWNFAGRQNDIQGHGDQMRGNWLSGIEFIDKMRLGAQGKDSPYFTQTNPSYNRFFFLPFILGLIGLIFHFYKAPKDAFIVLLTFVFTGLAIVVYLNQKPFEPRERDYAYAASFYAFSMWIGLGVYALYDAFKSFAKKEYKGMLIVALAGLPLCFIIDLASGDYSCISAWIYISIVAFFLIGLMSGLRSVLKNHSQGALFSILITLVVPILMAVQGWDDHSRKGKTSARDLAYNYLMSCEKNAILFTNGDNDTFPLWYLQEVEGKRTDVRVCNLSLMQTDWYTEQMKMKAYESEPLPIKFREDQIIMYAGGTDQVFFLSMLDIMNAGVPRESLEKIYKSKIKNNELQFKQSFNAFRAGTLEVMKTLRAKDPSVQAKLNQIQGNFNRIIEDASYKDLEILIDDSYELLSGYANGLIEGSQEAMQQFQKSMRDWEKSWDFLPLDEAMEFVRDDKNQIVNAGRELRVFPSRGFILKVNKENAVKSGLITEEQKERSADELRFSFEKPALTREQVMMLDIMANNDWKRPIYFSSPGGSEVSISLYQSGFVKQNGMTYELTPIQDRDLVLKEKMYHNVMNVYDYGKMNQKGVLTDYYTRRHTNQYRDHFARLADAYLREADFEERRKDNFDNQIKSLQTLGRTDQADSLRKIIEDADERITNNKKLAIGLIKKSIEVMPIDLVLDFGEPNPTRDSYEFAPGEKYSVYSDGSTQDYVSMLFRAGDFEYGNKLGMEIADQIESILNYFEKSPAMFSVNNKMDLVSALNNYMVIAMGASEDKNGILAKRTFAKIQELYDKSFPEKYNELKRIAENKGESVRPGSRPGYYGASMTDLKNHLEALGMRYGFIEQNKSFNEMQGGGDLTPEQIQMLMQQMQEQQ
jgi:hypothetical protein